MRPYCAGAFLFYGHESDAFRRPVFTWYELSKINAHTEYTAKKSPANLSIYRTLCGERGIRTPGTSQYAGFQDRCIRPLCHLSNSLDCIVASLSIVTFRFTFAGAKVVINVGFAKLFINKFHKKVKKSGSSLYI